MKQEEELRNEYISILKLFDLSKINEKEDKYSGVFLPIPFKEYFNSKTKIMLVGRETAGWNTDNNKNTLGRISKYGAEQIVDEGIIRYKKHLSEHVGKRTKSKFKQYYFNIAKELKIEPSSMIYSNFFAWDYDRLSPVKRPKDEFDYVASLSIELLSAQIKILKPNYIIFAAGNIGVIDPLIRNLFNNEYITNKKSVVPRKFWEFKVDDLMCFRVAHPRASNGHAQYRDLVIDRIKLLELE